MRPVTSAVTLFACALVLSIPARAQDSKKSQTIVKDGIEIEFTVEPASVPKTKSVMAGEDAVFRFKIRDTASKTPVSGVKPAAWVAQRERPGPPGPDQCRAKVQSYLQGSLRSRPDVDLNAFYLLALNEQPSISVIDPLIGFGGSKLLALVLLKSPGEDWALTSRGSKLFVSMPLVDHVAVVDTTTWKVTTDVATGARPTRIVLQPDEKYLWVGDEKGVTVIDTATLKVAKHIATGAGQHEIAFAGDNKFAFVTNRDDGTLSVVDVATLKKLKDVKTGARATSLAFSPLSKALYVVNDGDGSIAVVDVASHEVLASIGTKPGIKNARFSPNGRWGFVPNPVTSIVYIFDASTNRLVHEQAAGEGPDQVAFTDTFAYVRSLRSEQVSAIRLSTVGQQLDVMKFPGGQKAPGTSTVFAATADAFVPAPEAGSILLTNPADKMIYYYSEGMAAPMGNFQNYRRVPRAVKVVDRSLREESLGVYSTTARLPKEGVYNVSLLIDSPRVVHCFEATATSNPAIKPDQKAAFRIEYLNKDAPLSTGEDHKVRFRVTDRETRKPNSRLKDLGVLVFLPPGNWQKRQIAKHVRDGVYEATVNVPESGVYLLFVESPSQRVQYRDLPHMMLHANAAPQPKVEHAHVVGPRIPSTPMNIPDVEVQDQDGRTLNFYTDLVKGKTVAINFIFTTCTTICGPLGATFARVQKELADRDVHLISVSVDPVTDTPARLKAWRQKFKASPGWTVVTGDKQKIDELRRALAAASVRPEDHTPMIVIGNDALGQWTRAYGMAKPSQLVRLLKDALNGQLKPETTKPN